MAINPRYITISRLFQEPYTFRVPKYQRNYAWKEENIDDFLDDLDKCYLAASTGSRRHHFFGGIVTIANNVPGSSRQDCEIVDGQQRLATFVILISRIISFCEILAREAASVSDRTNEELAKKRVSRLTGIYLKFEDEVNRRAVTLDKLQLSSPDHQFFKDLVYNLSPSVSRDSHILLKRAFDSINKKVEGIINNESLLSDKLDAIKKIEDILLEDFTIIYISTDNKPEAYRLFQVLNNRGMSLTEGDLLRAKTLELLDSPSFTDLQDTIEKCWDNILSEGPDFTEKFLRTYYTSVQGKRPSTSGLFDDFLEKFFPDHNNSSISNDDANKITRVVQNMESEIVIFRRLNEGDWPYSRSSKVTQWDTDRLSLLIKALRHINCMPLLLSACKLDEQKFSIIVNLVEKFAYRYKIICQAHMTPLSNKYNENAKLIRQNPSTYSISSLKSDFQTLQSRVPDALFETQLNELKYSASKGNQQIRYLLMTIEHYLRWYENGATGEPRCVNKSRTFDFSNTSIEHIYPQNPSASNVNRSLEPLKHNLGNLTFLGKEDNELVDDSDFSTKKPILQSSSIQLNNKIAQNQNWTTSTVETRQRWLIDIAKKVFKL